MTREEFLPVFLDFLDRNDRFLIGGHENPDGDCIGAANALARVLQARGKEASLYFDGSIETYAAMTELMEPLTLEEAQGLMDTRTCAFILLDAAEDKRLGKGSALPSQAVDFLCIDHHVRTCEFDRLTYVESTTSATCEILYHLFTMAGIQIDRQMASALQMGVAFDTGGFRHSNTTGDTFRMGGAMVDRGADNTKLMNALYHTISLKEMKVIGTAFRKAKLYSDGILMAAMTEADFAKTGATSDEASGIVGRLAECAEAEVTIFLREVPDKIIVSLRSRSKVDVSAVARQFGGGGHRLASGCSIQEPMLLAKRMILDAVRAQIRMEA